MEKLKPNSYKSKQAENTTKEPKNVQKVVKSEVKVKKKSGLRKLVDVFVGTDGLEDIKENLSSDIRKTISNTLTDTIQTLLVGGPQGRNNSAYRNERPSYRNSYNSNGRVSDRSARSVYDYDDLIFDSRGEAEMVLKNMDEVIATYKAVSVADMYDFAGVSCNYTDNRYGWTNLSEAKVVRVTGGGYSLKLPPAEPLG